MYRIIKINCYNTQVWCACLLQGCVCEVSSFSAAFLSLCKLGVSGSQNSTWIKCSLPCVSPIYHLWNKLGLSKLPPLELCTYLLFGMLIYISNSQHFNICILNFPPIWRTASNCLCLVKVNFSSLLPLVLHCIGNFLKCYLKYKIVILGS